MVSLQILNKIIHTGDMSIITSNGLDRDWFTGYEDEFDFISNHYKKYGNVPDAQTFLNTFKDFDLFDVSESDKYLVDTLKEEHLYYKAIPILQDSAEILKSNSNDAVQYLLSQLALIQSNCGIGGTDIISQANERFEEYEKKLNGDGESFITTGFRELDDIVHGWQKGEEFVVFFARTGQGKSWVLAKCLTHAWQIGNNVGYISPEMSANSVGYRFDALYKHFSNKDLVWGNQVDGYTDYVDTLKDNHYKFMVATPLDFDKRITVSKLKTFCQQNEIGILGIDGITYLTDERAKKGDNKTTALTNISEDLMQLSLELNIPILVVVQSNRGGLENNDGPELENIRDSDGIAYNATKVISIRQTNEDVIELKIKKHRNGRTGGKVLYRWDIDSGNFEYLPTDDDTVAPKHREEQAKEIQNRYAKKDNRSCVF